MKKIISLILTAILLITPCFVLTGCEFGNPVAKTVYVATADFFYSEDNGHSYGNGKKVYSVGETVYMQVIVKITSNKETPEPISFRLTIPGVETVIAKYFDGQPVTPLSTTDGEVIYEFTIPANGPDEAGRFVLDGTEELNKAFVN